jgi:hypothetical protein
MSPPHVIVSVLASAWLVPQKKAKKIVPTAIRRPILPIAMRTIALKSDVQTAVVRGCGVR